MAIDEEGQSTIVASFAKNKQELVCLGISLWKGSRRLFVRMYIASLDAQPPVPTREGATLPVEQYPALLQGVRALEGAGGKEMVAAKLDKNKSQQVWVGATVYKERPLLYIRTYATFAGSPELKPTKQGVSIRADLYPQLLESVEKLGEALKNS